MKRTNHNTAQQKSLYVYQEPDENGEDEGSYYYEDDEPVADLAHSAA